MGNRQHLWSVNSTLISDRFVLTITLAGLIMKMVLSFFPIRTSSFVLIKDPRLWKWVTCWCLLHSPFNFENSLLCRWFLHLYKTGRSLHFQDWTAHHSYGQLVHDCHLSLSPRTPNETCRSESKNCFRLQPNYAPHCGLPCDDSTDAQYCCNRVWRRELWREWNIGGGAARYPSRDHGRQ